MDMNASIKYFYENVSMKEVFRKINCRGLLSILLAVFVVPACERSTPAIVFQSDFGLKDGAVSAMKGVSLEVDNNLKLYDITHEIPPYNIWEAAYRLEQTASYWPKGTVFCLGSRPRSRHRAKVCSYEIHVWPLFRNSG